MNDALTIARWCWPDANEWRMSETGDWALRDTDDGRLPDSFDPSIPYDVIYAEEVVIERGLRRQYGNELHKIVAEESGVGDFPDGDWDATIATAPLDARVRAMAAAIRARSDPAP